MGHTGYIVWHIRDHVPLAILPTYEEAVAYGEKYGFELALPDTEDERGFFVVLDAPLLGGLRRMS